MMKSRDYIGAFLGLTDYENFPEVGKQAIEAKRDDLDNIYRRMTEESFDELKEYLKDEDLSPQEKKMYDVIKQIMKLTVERVNMLNKYYHEGITGRTLYLMVSKDSDMRERYNNNFSKQVELLEENDLGLI